jgi:hypothetical protein
MPEVNLSIEIHFIGDGDDEQFEAFLDKVLDGFDGIGREVNFAARITDRIADIDVSLEADSFEDAAIEFLGDVRTALHAAGAGTPRWPIFRPARRVVRELQEA